MGKVSLKINGKIWQGWKSVNTTRSLGAVCGEHQLEITNKWQGAQIFPLKEGMAVELFIGEDKVATGYITARVPSYDASSVSYQISARCKTIDLVESSLVHSTGEWKNVTLDILAKEICQPYGISVVIETDLGASFSTVRLEQGESPFELLERLTRQRAVLLTSDNNGNLVLCRASKKMLNVTLELGKNILAARGNFSESERFSSFIVKSAGNAASWGDETVTSKEITVDDESIKRYRPKIILSEEIFTVAGASRRGQWQKQRALAFSFTLEITVTGWRMPDGALWPVNQRIKVIDSIMGINEILLISSVSHGEDAQGRKTTLSLVPPDSMDVIAQLEKKTKATVKW